MKKLFCLCLLLCLALAWLPSHAESIAPGMPVIGDPSADHQALYLAASAAQHILPNWDIYNSVEMMRAFCGGITVQSEEHIRYEESEQGIRLIMDYDIGGIANVYFSSADVKPEELFSAENQRKYGYSPDPENFSFQMGSRMVSVSPEDFVKLFENIAVKRVVFTIRSPFEMEDAVDMEIELYNVYEDGYTRAGIVLQLQDGQEIYLPYE